MAVMKIDIRCRFKRQADRLPSPALIRDFPGNKCAWVKHSLSDIVGKIDDYELSFSDCK